VETEKTIFYSSKPITPILQCSNTPIGAKPLSSALSNEAGLTARKPQEVVEVFLIRFKYPYKQGMGIKHAAKTLE
jgi:hypothetical protein